MKSKIISRLIPAILMMAAAFVSCTKEEVSKDIADPVVEITSTDLEGLPGEGLNLTAKISDDLGIKYILIESADWEFSKKIPFSEQNRITEYNLTESIIIPAEVERGTTGEVIVKAFDFEDKMGSQSVEIKVTEEPARLSIIQEMGYNIVLTGTEAKVTDNVVKFVEVEGGAKLPVNITVTSNVTKVKSLIIKSEEFGIDQTIDLAPLSSDNGKKATIKKDIKLNKVPDDQKHEILFKLIDDRSNEAVYTPTVAVKTTFEKVNGKEVALFFQEKGMDMNKVLYGLPMIMERKIEASKKFTACYYAKANTEIYFVNTKDTAEQVKFGMSKDGKYIIKSENPLPYVIKEDGHYEFKIDLLTGSISINKLPKQETGYPQMHYVFGWGGDASKEMTQVDPENAPAIWKSDDRLAGGSMVEFGIGNGQYLVANGLGDRDPEVWYIKADKDKYPQYGAAFDPMIKDGVTACDCNIYFDTFLMKGYVVMK